jgi:hypothetical protein
MASYRVVTGRDDDDDDEEEEKEEEEKEEDDDDIGEIRSYGKSLLRQYIMRVNWTSENVDYVVTQHSRQQKSYSCDCKIFTRNFCGGRTEY